MYDKSNLIVDIPLMKHSVKMKSTPKVALGSGSRNINYSQDTPTTSSTNEEKNSFKDAVTNILYKKKTL